MSNPNKKYKYGQLMTIDHKVYRITKCDGDNIHCNRNCLFKKYINACLCLTGFPRGSYLKRIL